MRRTLLAWMIGIPMVGLVALSIGNRPPVRAGTAAQTELEGAFGGRSDEPLPKVQVAAAPMSLEATRTWLKLQAKVPMRFATDTPLEDVKKYVEAVTATKEDPESGIEVYVDLKGLQDVDKSLASTILIDLKSVPLATSLKLALAQISLIYFIQEDGILVITSQISDGAPAQANLMILEQLSTLRGEIQMLREEVRSLHRVGFPENTKPTGNSNNPPVTGNKGGMM